MRLKRCPKCSQDLELTSFDRNGAANDGLQTWCRSCRKKHMDKKMAANRKKWEKEDPYEGAKDGD